MLPPSVFPLSFCENVHEWKIDIVGGSNVIQVWETAKKDDCGGGGGEGINLAGTFCCRSLKLSLLKNKCKKFKCIVLD